MPKRAATSTAKQFRITRKSPVRNVTPTQVRIMREPASATPATVKVRVIRESSTAKLITVQVRIIRRSLTAIDRSLVRLVALTNGAGLRASAYGEPPKRKLKLSPERRAALKLQGQYMGYLRNLEPRQKAQVKALREEKGMRAAVALARRIARQ